ncbi:uncharacterized protein LOC143194156 [Rhynchophorus ferrugineus]|uniref:uncharacterized protein LOC143194156 n=1 Tax=Rhynchophorus ferrugineus TaxID=354439 RepID=UPI003FCCCCE0
MSNNSKSDFFDFLRKISIPFLLIPPKNYVLRRIYYILVVPHFTLLGLIPVSELIEITIVGTGNFSTDMLVFGILMMHSMGLMRLLASFILQNRHQPIVTSIRKWRLDIRLFCYSNLLNISKRKLAIPIHRHPISKYKVDKMEEAKRLCVKLLMYLLFYVILNISMTYTLNYQRPVYERFNGRLNRTSLYRDYAYSLYYPFDTSISDGYYLIGFFYQPYSFFFLMSSFMCVHMFGVGSCIYLKCKADITGYAFKYVDRNIDHNQCYKDVIMLKKIRIVNCINELQDIYECAYHVNKVVSIQMLFQMFFVGMILCSVAYRVESVKSAGELFYLTSMAGVSLLICYFACWYSQEFTLQVEDISNRIQDLDWLSYPHSLRKTLVFLMMRLQKPFWFTLAEWTPSDTGAVFVLVKTSYSFYTLIKNTGSTIKTG